MSDFVARQAFQRMNLREVLVAPFYAMLADDLRMLALANPEEQLRNFMARRNESCDAFGFQPQAQEKPFAFANGIAVIPIAGTLLNRFGSSYGFATGYNFIRRQHAMALADEDVKGIIFDVNSHGGEAAGCFELANDIFKARAQKPNMAVIDSNCFSAGYALASAASAVVSTPSGSAGSIGVVMMHADISKMVEDFGVKITFVKFGAHKTDGNMFEALSDDVKKDMQTRVDKSGDKFVQLVARNRNMDAAKVKATEARCYSAEDALALGLIDTIATPSEATQVFFDGLTGSVQQPGKEDKMSDQTKPGATTPAATTAVAGPPVPPPTDNAAALQQASNDARTAERARVKGIIGCEEAKDKTALANHLAMETSMTVDEAKAMLKVAAPQATASGTNAFQAAMNNSQHPNVGAGGEDGGSGDPKADVAHAKAQEILASQQKATGLKLIASK